MAHYWAIAAAAVAAACVVGARAREAPAPAADVPAYVISLPGTRPRAPVAARFQGKVSSLQFFDAVDGTTLPRMGKLKPGEAGCAASHARLWASLLRAGGGPALVFEDDARPADDFGARLGDVLRRIDDSIDVVFLGHCYERQGSEYAPGLRNSVQPRCTHGYLVTRRGVRTLAGWASRARLERAIDEELAALIGRGGLRALSCFPPLVTTTADDSLIVRMGGRWFQ